MEDGKCFFFKNGRQDRQRRKGDKNSEFDSLWEKATRNTTKKRICKSIVKSGVLHVAEVWEVK